MPGYSGTTCTVATLAFSETPGAPPLRPDGRLVTVALAPGGVRIPVPVEVPGWYALFTQHGAVEVGLTLHSRTEPLTPMVDRPWGADPRVSTMVHRAQPRPRS